MKTPTRIRGWIVGSIVCVSIGLTLLPSAHGQLPPSVKCARVVYQESGGLLGVENRLSLFDDGRVVYATADVRGARTIEWVVPAREVDLLNALFVGTEFMKMPPAFKADGIVMDGVTYLVTYKSPDGPSHTVQSETLAAEPLGFVMIREQCAALGREVLDAVVFEMKARGGFVGEDHSLVVRASGEWAYRCETPGHPERTHDARGVFPPAQLARLSGALLSDEFMSLPVCLGGHGGADVVDYEVSAAMDGAHHTVHFTDLSPAIPHVLTMVEGSMSRLIARVEP
ncbi:MAG: hypothetical protein HYR85_23335 [Planctomycetes bacterium]|nr:hypothetical protein [Planctomycetota bacterium]MBI3847056.1 hypothetical protein [Planctomycetota bacterium]